MTEVEIALAAGAVALVGALIPLVKMVLTAWANVLVRKADQLYNEQPQTHSHEDKQTAAKDALLQTGVGRFAPRSITDTIKPGESDRPPKE